MENPARRRLAVRPIPLAILGLMIGILALVYQLDTIYYASSTGFAYVLWGLGFFVIVWATWVEPPETSARKKE